MNKKLTKHFPKLGGLLGGGGGCGGSGSHCGNGWGRSDDVKGGSSGRLKRRFGDMAHGGAVALVAMVVINS